VNRRCFCQENLMNLELHSSRIAISESTQDYVERRIAFALGRFEDAIHSVAVRLEDTNGPRGGVDKLCRMRVRLVARRPPIIAEALESEVRVAIDTAAETASRAVARDLERRSSRRRDTRAEDLMPMAD
jgi:putative sigma-54 modulation protein